MYTLGIETSCDETSCAILKNNKVVSLVTLSSLKEHKKYGGVIPEIATRAHLKSIDIVTQAALDEAKISVKKIDLIAVTSHPGLIGALVVGVNFAKTLALSLGKPIIGINHLHAHIFSAFIDNNQPVNFPFLGVVVSGGHTDIYLVKDFDKIKLIGETMDDACGEVYDKVARILGLGYPGGPIIDKLFNPGLKNNFNFKCGRDGLNLSFSGIKTAVMYKKMEMEKAGEFKKSVIVPIVSSFQESVVKTIVEAVKYAVKKYKINRIVCGGGVIANKYLRGQLIGLDDMEVFLPPLKYTGDNAAIVAGLGFYLYNKKGKKSDFAKLKAEPN